jgi:predicted glycosyltransferase
VKIWIDILTPKQALFFAPIAHDLSKRGYDVMLTSRQYPEAESVLRMLGLDAEVVGRHGGETLAGKLVASAERVLKLIGFVADKGFDAALCFASPECARVAFGLNIPLFCVNDSPHSEKVAKLTTPLASILFTPWVIPPSIWAGYGIPTDRVVVYRALDPAAWLKHNIQPKNEPKLIQLDRSKKIVALRLEESQAYYLNPDNLSWTTSVIDRLLSEASEANLLILGRNQMQREELKRKYAGKLIILEEPYFGPTLLKNVDVFVGMGGTMTVEAALLGVPTISAQRIGRLFPEEYLVEQGLIMKPGSPEAVAKAAKQMLRDTKLRAQLQTKAKRVLARMEDPVEKIASTIEAELIKAR